MAHSRLVRQRLRLTFDDRVSKVGLQAIAVCLCRLASRDIWGVPCCRACCRGNDIRCRIDVASIRMVSDC